MHWSTERLPALSGLDGFGRLGDPSPYAVPIAGADWNDVRVGPRHPPGVWQPFAAPGAQSEVSNAVDADTWITFESDNDARADENHGADKNPAPSPDRSNDIDSGKDPHNDKRHPNDLGPAELFGFIITEFPKDDPPANQ